MRNKSFQHSVFVLLSMILSACAGKAPGTDSVDPRLLIGQSRISLRSVSDYAADYKGIVTQTSGGESHVLCLDCKSASGLERELGEVPLSLLWGVDKAATREPITTSGGNIARFEPAKAESFSTTLSILFDFDSSSLDEKGKSQVLASLDRLRKAVSVQMTGFTCSIGPKEYNDKLALRRAGAVAAFLEERGIKPDVINGRGKCCYVSGDERKNRRVEIEFQQTKGE